MIKKSIRIKLTSLREATNDHFFDSLLENQGDIYEEDWPVDEEEPEGPMEL